MSDKLPMGEPQMVGLRAWTQRHGFTIVSDEWYDDVRDTPAKLAALGNPWYLRTTKHGVPTTVVPDVLADFVATLAPYDVRLLSVEEKEFLDHCSFELNVLPCRALSALSIAATARQEEARRLASQGQEQPELPPEQSQPPPAA